MPQSASVAQVAIFERTSMESSHSDTFGWIRRACAVDGLEWGADRSTRLMKACEGLLRYNVLSQLTEC